MRIIPIHMQAENRVCISHGKEIQPKVLDQFLRFSGPVAPDLRLVQIRGKTGSLRG